ncbi:hypothetical protein [Clavibacter nebraskensis]|uniref:hypothetical protein n=1 Tax=Clavibacter nebraskensis TaxID=31963 RepID=UPI003F4B0D81
MIATQVATGYRFARYRLRLLKRWVFVHPRRSIALALFLGWLVLALVASPSAYADGDGDVTLPWMPPNPPSDSQGVSLTHYAILPLDRGDTWTLGKTFIANIIDPMWTLTIGAVAWVLWLFQWLLEFSWVGWLATPISGIATTLQTFMAAIGWIPFALTLTAFAAGMVFMSGRYAMGGMEALISIICAVMAVGILANPVGTLTGDNGVFHWSQTWGGNLAASVTSDDGKISTDTPTDEDAGKVISTTITTQLADIFVRRPAQVIAFGKELTGDCDETFTTQMKATNPIDTSSNAVRDAVGGCDSAAGKYVTNPNFGQVFTALSIMSGSTILLSLGVGFGMVLFMAVLYALFQALKLTGSVYAAVAPGVVREALWKSLFGMYISAMGVGGSVIVLAAYLKILVNMLTSASAAGMNVLAQTTLISMVVTALMATLFIARHRAHKAGTTLAKRLARLGFGAASAPRNGHLAKDAIRAAERFLPRPKPGIAPQQSQEWAMSWAARRRIPGDAGPTPRDGGHFTASPVPSPDGGTPGSSLGSTALGGVKTAAQLALASATGGSSSVAMKVATVAGTSVLQRHLVVPEQGLQSGPRVVDQPTPHATIPFGRQIVVGKDGTGRVAPATAPKGRVYQATPVRPARTVRADPLRESLKRAAMRELTS